jgi:hypothetical protein
MTHHLSQEQIARYLRRQGSSSEAAETETHIAECAECQRHILSERNSEGFQNTDLRQGHFTYAALEAFVDGTLSPQQRETLLAHSARCQTCAAELRDLQAFRGELLGANRSPAPARGRARPLPWIILTGGGLAAVLILVLLLLVFNKKTGAPGPDAGRPTPSALPPKGDDSFANEIAALMPEERQLVMMALQQARIAPPAVIIELQGHPQVLRSKQQEEAGPRPLQPVGEVIADMRPLFRWRPVQGARSYSIVILDSRLKRVEASPALQETEWKPSQSLQRGRVYQWVVKASLDNGSTQIAPAPPDVEAKFKVLDQAHAEQINRLREAHSHLVLGILYAQAGMLTLGEGEWSQIAAGGPDHELAQKLIRSVEDIRRPGQSER